MNNGSNLPASPAPPRRHDLVPADLAEALEDLFVRGTPENTLRAYERDLAYITAWKQALYGTELAWPEAEEVALRFLLDHARDLSEAAPEDRARQAAEALISAGLRKSLRAPCPGDTGPAHCVLARFPPHAQSDQSV